MNLYTSSSSTRLAAQLPRLSALLLVAAVLVTSQVIAPATALANTEAATESAAETQFETADVDAVNTLTYVPKIGRSACWASNDPSIFGVQMYGTTGNNHDKYDDLIGTGVDWIRVPVKWSMVENVEHDPPVYDWSSADQSVQAALESQACKRIILTHQSAPTWAAEFFAESVISVDKLDSFDRYITALAERYDGDGIDDAPGSPVVNYFELYNEPDASVANFGHSGWGEAAGVDLHHPAYVNMLNIAYDGIKSANPKAQVLLGGIAHDWFTADEDHPDRDGIFVEDFLYDVLELGGGDYFDIFNVHVYPSFADVWIPQVDPDCTLTNSCVGPGLLEKVTVMRNVLEDNGLSDKPIFITESGWYSEAATDIPSNETVHARYVVELSVQAKAAGAEVMILFSLIDPDLTLHKYGLVTDSGRRKPAYGAYVHVVNRLGDATFVRSLTDAETNDPFMEAHEFMDPGTDEAFIVAWRNPAEMGEDLDLDGTPDTELVEMPLTLSANQANVYDMYGGLKQTIAGTQGSLSVQIGADPLYIVLAQ